MKITDWPKAERPREKLLAQGASTLSDAELLAIFLRTGIAGKSAVDISRELMNKYKSLRALLHIDEDAFCATKGLGKAKYVQFQAILELSKRYLQENVKRSGVMDSPQLVKSYLQATLRDCAREIFGCLFLDVHHRVIEFEQLFQGTINEATVHPRELVKRALANNAAAIILVHNHPSGDPSPSKADISITQQLASIMRELDIKLLDHFIIGDQVVSLAEQGLFTFSHE